MTAGLTETQLRHLREGSQLKYHGVQWLVQDYSTYTDDNGYETEEWQLKSSSGKAYYLLREVDPQTGEVVRQRDVPGYFAEGLALVDDRLIQLTWKDGIALVYDRDTFAYEGAYFYTNEEWGLCYDGASLYHSDGSQYIIRRDAVTFEALDQIEVTYGDQAIIRLNELECVRAHIYANVWQTDFIIRIDKATGVVDGLIDASGLLTQEQRPVDGDGVLNGIAYDAANDVFYITGKLWSLLFEVRFVPFES